MRSWRKRLHPETRAVLAWMMEEDVLLADIARDLKVTNSAVSHFLAGRIASAGLRAHFIAIGCPQRLVAGLDRLRGKRRLTQAARKDRPARRPGRTL